MKRNILLLSALFCLNVIMAQNMTFINQNVYVDGVTASDFEGVGHDSIHNVSNVDLDLRWNSNLVEKADTWTFAVCDKNQCYNTSVVQEDFLLVPDEKGTMDVHAYTNATEGYATVEITVTDLADPSSTVSGLYYFNSGLNNTKEASRQLIKVYPNPSNGLFSVKGEKGIDRVEVYSLAGTKVKSFTYGDGQWYDISDLPRGTYLVRLMDRDAQQLVTKLMNKL